MKSNNFMILLFFLIIYENIGAQTFEKKIEYARFKPALFISAIPTIDSGFIYAGTIDSLNDQHDKIFIFKLNSIGDTIWTHIISAEDSSNWEINDIAEIDDSNFISIGYIKNITSVDSAEGISIMKFDFYGNVVWNKMIIDSGNYLAGYKIITALDKGFYIMSNGLIKVDSMGEFQWAKKYSLGVDLIQSSDSSLYLWSGYNFDSILVAKIKVDGDLVWTKIYPAIGFNPILLNVENNYFILTGQSGNVIKFDSSGALVWSIGMTMGYGFSCHAATIAYNGNYIFAGSEGNNNGNAFIIMDSTGVIVSKSTFTLPYSNFVNTIIETYDNGYLLAGQYVDLPGPGGTGNHFPLMIKLDSLFHIHCEISDTFLLIPFPGNWQYTNITLNVPISNYYTMYYPQAITIRHGGYIIDLCLSSSVNETEKYILSSIFPNPSTGQINFSEEVSSVLIYNILGSQIAKYSNVSNGTIDLYHLQKGIYFCEMRLKNKSVVLRKIVLQ